MARLFLSLLFTLIINVTWAQPIAIDSLKHVLLTTKNDTLRLVLCQQLSGNYSFIDIDSSLYFAKQYLQLAQQFDYKLNEADALNEESFSLYNIGDDSAAVQLLFKALAIVESTNSTGKILPLQYLNLLHVPPSVQSPERYRLYILSYIHFFFGNYYSRLNPEKQLEQIYTAKQIAESIDAPDALGLACMWLGFIYLDSHTDSSQLYLQQAETLILKGNANTDIGSIQDFMSTVYHNKNKHAEELNSLRNALQSHTKYGNTMLIGFVNLRLADYFFKHGNTNQDSIIYYSQKALQIGKVNNFPEVELAASRVLINFYKAKHQVDSAFKYQEEMIAANDRLYNLEKVRDVQKIDFNNQLQQEQLAATKKQFQSQLKIYALLVGLGLLLLLAFLLWRNNKRSKKVNKLLQEQKNEIQNTLQELKSTQAQLIQSEKMASLGQLTAGIAHEIQNPLNFVNNFSEINTELITELEQEIGEGDLEEIKVIINNLKDNEQKIIHHGKRADSIVKGMLQHSRESSGKKELTVINALVDECLRLSYHGMSAKDKEFNATIKTDLDDSIGKLDVVPQDISRVLLNLLNNAFYAVDEKKRQLNGMYEPAIAVCTRKLDDKVEIHVRDNGYGIPQNLIDKIFQPFFTTKPTGQGTGLGLSLSYDIIKAHGGDIKVESKEGEGSEFIIRLP